MRRTPVVSDSVIDNAADCWFKVILHSALAVRYYKLPQAFKSSSVAAVVFGQSPRYPGFFHCTGTPFGRFRVSNNSYIAVRRNMVLLKADGQSMGGFSTSVMAALGRNVAAFSAWGSAVFIGAAGARAWLIAGQVSLAVHLFQSQASSGCQSRPHSFLPAFKVVCGCVSSLSDDIMKCVATAPVLSSCCWKSSCLLICRHPRTG